MPDAPKKKLIEVALPLDAINAEAGREKSIRHGHPSTLHLWWARRPLAACRAVLFASMVDDPSAHPEQFPTEEDQENERQRLFALIEELVKWENINNEKVLEKARREIRKYAPEGGPPPVLDPFAGGGSIPLEAQRLGLEAHAGDLNPVAVLINKAMIEIPPRFAGQPPVNPEARDEEGKPLGKRKWKAARGLAEDVRYYGQWMREQAEARIGDLYPTVTITQAMLDERADLREQGYDAGDELTVIAWLWARTVPSPNPAAEGARVPLVRSFWLSKGRKKYGQKTWVNPVVDRDALTYRFEVQRGEGQPPKGTIKRGGGRCLLTDAPLPRDHVREQAKAGKLSARLMAVVAEGERGRTYFAPTEAQEQAATEADPAWRPSGDLPGNSRHSTPPSYGMTTWADLFTERQLTALTTFSDLVPEARRAVCEAGEAAGVDDPAAYADAVATYLAFAVSKHADRNSSICSWDSSRDSTRNAFARQAVPMVWDFAEVNPFSDSTGNFSNGLDWGVRVLEKLVSGEIGAASQTDAASSVNGIAQPVISTDPPYYDNVPYADLSDFFYVWLRRSLDGAHSDLFRTMTAPKAAELVADPFRHGGKDAAKAFFEDGLRTTFGHVRTQAHPDYPMTVYYAFKQSEVSVDDEEASTGWETMLSGLVDAGFRITGTWPMRTELSNRMRGIGSNALASSVVLACRPRPEDAPRVTRGQFLKALNDELPEALRDLQRGFVAPVDLTQASIGPGMAVFSRYREVVEADGSPMRVRTALALINQVLDEYLTEQESEYEADTRWALAWHEQYGFEDGPYGDAETLSTAVNTSVRGLQEAGIVKSGGGQVRLHRRDELDAGWNPAEDDRLTVWESTQHLIRALEAQGEEAAARLLAALRQRSGSTAEAARALAYRLYALCERKERAEEALAYNSLIVAWPQVERLAREAAERQAVPEQGELEL